MTEELSDKLLTESSPVTERGAPPVGPAVNGFFYGGVAGVAIYAVGASIALWLDGYYNRHMDPLCCTVYSVAGTIIGSHAFGIPVIAGVATIGGIGGSVVSIYKHYRHPQDASGRLSIADNARHEDLSDKTRE